jgi:hypothetical protein
MHDFKAGCSMVIHSLELIFKPQFTFYTDTQNTSDTNWLAQYSGESARAPNINAPDLLII